MALLRASPYAGTTNRSNAVTAEAPYMILPEVEFIQTVSSVQRRVGPTQWGMCSSADVGEAGAQRPAMVQTGTQKHRD